MGGQCGHPHVRVSGVTSRAGRGRDHATFGVVLRVAYHVFYDRTTLLPVVALPLCLVVHIPQPSSLAVVHLLDRRADLYPRARLLPSNAASGAGVGRLLSIVIIIPSRRR